MCNYYWFAYISLVILLLISLLTAFPLTNVTERQLTDESNNKVVLPNSFSLISNNESVHIQAKENESVLPNTYDNPASSKSTQNANSAMKATSNSDSTPTYTTSVSSTNSDSTPWYTTSAPLTDPDSTPWYVYFLIAFFILCCCCGGGAGAARAKTGRWVPARVWVEDWI